VVGGPGGERPPALARMTAATHHDGRQVGGGRLGLQLLQHRPRVGARRRRGDDNHGGLPLAGDCNQPGHIGATDDRHASRPLQTLPDGLGDGLAAQHQRHHFQPATSARAGADPVRFR